MKRNVIRHAVTQPLDQSIKLIALTKGQTMKVSAHRYDEFMQFSWAALKGTNIPGFYAITKVWRAGRYFTIYAHRFALGLKAGDPREGDHRNHDTLDNTDDNLRIANRTQQNQNRNRPNSNKSGQKGVTFYKRTKRWRACINVDGKHFHIGYFPTYEEAVIAHKTATEYHFGEFAHL